MQKSEYFLIFIAEVVDFEKFKFPKISKKKKFKNLIFELIRSLSLRINDFLYKIHLYYIVTIGLPRVALGSLGSDMRGLLYSPLHALINLNNYQNYSHFHSQPKEIWA